MTSYNNFKEPTIGSVNGDKVLESIGCTEVDWMTLGVRHRALMRELAERCAQSDKIRQALSELSAKQSAELAKVKDALSRLRYPDIQGTL